MDEVKETFSEFCVRQRDCESCKYAKADCETRFYYDQGKRDAFSECVAGIVNERYSMGELATVFRVLDTIKRMREKNE